MRDEPPALAAISWVLPDRPLGPELATLLDTGYVRGADCWHLACALYLAGHPGDLTFVTRDTAQRKVARVLGFRV